MKQSLPRHRGRRRIVPRGALLDALADQERSPPALVADRLDPARHLPVVVVAPPPQVEATVPLKPPVGILRPHPALVLPKIQVVAALDAVLVNLLAIFFGSDQTRHVDIFKPIEREFEVDADGKAALGGLGGDGPVVSPPKAPARKI